jgi:hypothetical protein
MKPASRRWAHALTRRVDAADQDGEAGAGVAEEVGAPDAAVVTVVEETAPDAAPAGRVADAGASVAKLSSP